MTTTKSGQRAVNKYIAKNYDRVNLTMKKGKKALLQKAADINGESVNSLLNRLIDDELMRLNLSPNGENGVGAEPNSNGENGVGAEHINDDKNI